MEDSDLKSAKQKSGISDFESVSVEDMAEINKLAGKGELSLDELQELVGAIPDFVELQKQTVEGLRETAEGAKESQKAAISAVQESLNGVNETLSILAESAENDEARLEIAKITKDVGEQGVKIAEIIEEMNRDNNNTWKAIAGGAGALALAIIAIFRGK